MEFERCPGCATTVGEASTRWDAQKLHTSIIATEQHIKQLNVLISEVGSFEDWAILEADVDERRKWLEVLRLVQECLPENRRRSRYGDRLGNWSGGFPGLKAFGDSAWDTDSLDSLFERLDPRHLDTRQLLKLYEISDLSWRKTLRHGFEFTDPMKVAQHFDILTSATSSAWPMILIDNLNYVHMLFIGRLLNLSPNVFISHMWRSFFERPLEFGLPLVETSSTRGIALELDHPVIGAPHPVLLTSDLPATSSGLPSAPGDKPFTRIIHDVSIDEIRQRQWAYPGYLFKPLRVLIEEQSNALRGRRVKGPLYWVDERSPNLPRGRGELPNSISHASIDYVASTSMFVMEASSFWPSQYGLILQSPKFYPGSDSDPVDPNQWPTWHLLSENPNADVFRRRDLGRPFPISSLVESVLVSSQCQQLHSWAESLTCRQRLVMIEVSATVSAILSVRDVINADVRTLHEVLCPESDYAQVLASRARAKRVLLAKLTKAISALTASAVPALPIVLHTRYRRAMDESLGIARSQLPVLDELDYAINEMREDRFRQLQIKLTQTQIEESRKAMRQADKVARLTVLAFIYIPTSCVCGIFGMNIIETPNGFPLWVFGVTLAVVLVTTLWIAFASRLYMFFVQLQYYWLKNFVYTRMDEESSFYPFLKVLVEIPRLTHKAYHRSRGDLRRYIEERRHLEGNDRAFKQWVLHRILPLSMQNDYAPISVPVSWPFAHAMQSVIDLMSRWWR